MSKLLQERWSKIAFLSEAQGPCWDGYERVPGTKEKEKGSCRKKGSANESDEILIGETDENAFVYAIASEKAKDPTATTATVDGEEVEIEMTHEKAKEIVGDEAIEEAITRWYAIINESGFDKEKKDKMKCNSPRRLRDGEPGHGKKSKVVKACDPDSDAEKIVKFGDPNMPIQSHHADNKASFRARHKCADKSMTKDWDAAGYWSCKEW